MTKYNFLFCIQACLDLYKKIVLEPLEDETRLIADINELETIDYSRFRVFLDACLIRLNKEKMESNFAEKFDYDGFIDYLNLGNESENSIFPDVIRRNTKIVESECQNNKEAKQHYNSLDVALYYPFPPCNISYKEQAKIIRNAFSHSQFSSFYRNASSGIISYYLADNADNHASSTYHGMIIEETVHEWIRAFFSDLPQFGIPFKYTSILSYSVVNDCQLDYCNYVEITPSNAYSEKYDGHSNNLMKIIGNMLNSGENVDISKFLKLIYDHKNEFIITEKPLSEIITNEEVAELCMQYDIKQPAEIIKMICDSDTMISYFISWLIYINDIVLEYKQNNIDASKLFDTIESVKEDFMCCTFIGRIGFALLQAWKYVYIIESDKDIQECANKVIQYFSKKDYSPITYHTDYSLIDISEFDYDENDMQNHINSNKTNHNAKKEFILKRFRNSLSHGGVRIETSTSNQIVIAFDDVNPKTKKVKSIRISLEELEKFVNTDKILSDFSPLGLEINTVF